MGGAGPLVGEYDLTVLLGDSLSLVPEVEVEALPLPPLDDSLKSSRFGLGAKPGKEYKKRMMIFDML